MSKPEQSFGQDSRFKTVVLTILTIQTLLMALMAYGYLGLREQAEKNATVISDTMLRVYGDQLR